MGSQFVDFNADGHLDYVTATFDGSPHISFGSADGFTKPVHIKDAQGRRIIISHFWNFEDEAHQKTGRSTPDGKPSDERCISALAYDWDADGDYDLLLGSYENGRLYRQMNEGTNAAPKFTGKNIPVEAGGKGLALPAKMTTPRLVDWDGDGDQDLIIGTFGDSYGSEEGGAVYLAINEGARGKPRFAALQTLIAPSEKTGTGPDRPDAGLYADAVDFDGDGDLDLVVGGYAMWTPESRTLTDEEKATVRQLRATQKSLQAEQSAIYAEISKEVAEATTGLERKSKEYREKNSEIFQRYGDRLQPVSKKLGKIRKQIADLVPSSKRESYVWLYERQ